MTSKISSSKLFGRELRQLSWLAAVQAVVYLMMIPFRALIALSAMSSGNPSAADKLNTLCRQIGFDRLENVLMVLIAGIICGMCVFSYVHSSVKVDLYHSLSIKREKLFLIKYAAGFVTFAVPYAAASMLGVLGGALYGAFRWRLILEMAVCTLQHMLFFLCSYSGTILAVMMTGKIVTSVCAVAVLFGYLPTCWLILQAYVSNFLSTSMQLQALFDKNMGNFLRYTSPWAFCIFWENGETGSRISYGLTGMWPGITGICELTAVFVLLTLAALALYHRRRSEVCGAALAFHRLEGVIKILLAVLAAQVAALVASELGSTLWEISFILLFSALGCMVMEFIYRWDIHLVLQHKGHIVISAVLASLIFFPIRYDVLGYNSYLPEKDEISEMAVQSLYNTYTYPEATEQKKSAKNKTESQKELDYLECDQIDTLYPLAENGVKFVKKSLENDYSFEEATVPVKLKYHLKDGKEVYRYYEVSEKTYLAAMDKLLSDRQYKEKYYPILGMDAKEIYEIEAECYQQNFPELTKYYPVSMAESTSYAEVQVEMETETETETDTDMAETKSGTKAGAVQDAADSQSEAAETESETDESTSDAESETAETDFWAEIMTTDGTYTDYGVQIEIPQSKKAEFLAAYRKDLETLPYEKLYAAMNALEVQLQSKRQTYEYDRYPLSQDFTNTVYVLEEIAKENAASDLDVVYG